MRRLLLFPAALVTAGLLLAAGSTGAASASTKASPAVPQMQPGGPIIRAHGSGDEPYPVTSLNWSGYADTAPKGKTFNNIHSSFVEPAISCDGKFTVTSNWVGLDGFNDGTVEQDGTAAYCSGAAHKTPRYYAWFELFPHPELIAFYLHPGDHMTASVVYAAGKYHLTLTDATSGQHASYTAGCADCLRSSAEWIIERPAVCTNKACTSAYLTLLADYHTTAMSDDQASLTGGALRGPTGYTDSYPLDMISQFRHKAGFISLDQVGAVSHDSFGALWERSGTTYPIHL